jgi:diacylglycerol kinase family enzyme
MAQGTALLLLNPGARKAGGGNVEIADALRERGLTVIAESLDDPGGIAGIIVRHAESVDRVIVGGGDGTLGSATRPAVDAGLPLAILPLGTANNVARTLGIPDDLDTACDIAAGNERRRIDVGEVNGRCFLTAASFGLSVAITETLSSEAKRRWGALGTERASGAGAHPLGWRGAAHAHGAGGGGKRSLLRQCASRGRGCRDR